MRDLVVLLGPPGSGKSFLAAAASQRWGFRWTEHEKLFLDRYGSAEAFVADKPAALAWVEAHLREQAGAAGATVLFESTGLSDEPMLRRLGDDLRLGFVRLDVPRATCVERVRSRPRGRHFQDDPEGAGRFHDFWTREIAPRWPADAVIENDVDPSSPDAAERTGALLERIERVAAG